MVAVGIVIGAFVTLVIFWTVGSVSADSVGFWSETVGFSVFEFSSLYSPFVRVKAAAASAAGFCDSKQRGSLYITLKTAVVNSTTAVLVFKAFSVSFLMFLHFSQNHLQSVHMLAIGFCNKYMPCRR